MGWQNQGKVPSDGSRIPGGDGTSGDQRSWRQPALGRVEPAARPVTASHRARRLQIVGSTFAITCAILFYLVAQLPGCTQTEMIVTTAFVYKTKESERSPIPPNWMGDSDQQALLQLQHKKLIVRSSQGELDFERQLKSVPKRSVCVVYVSAHAALEPYAVDPSVDRVETKDADVVLLSTKDDLDAVSTRVRLNDLWIALKRLPKEQKKLVLLDVGRLLGQWRLGVYDSFAVAGIEEAVAREKIPNLFVMTSCAAGETSWVSPELGGDAGQSVFGHFVLEGLLGEADKRPDGKYRDRRITVRELYEYVSRRVNDWVQRNRDSAGQHPQLFPNEKVLEGADTTFVVGAVPSRKNSPKSDRENMIEGAAPVELSNAQDKLFKVWDRRAKLDQAALTANAIYHLEPIRWRAMTHLLMQAEEFLIHHRAQEAGQAITVAETLCSDLEGRFRRGRLAELESEPQFLAPMAARFGLGSAAEVKLADSGGSPIPLPDDQLRRVLQEAHLRHGIPESIARSDAERCRTELVALRQLAEQVAFGHHTVFPWLQQELAVADQVRREAEDAFFVRDGTAVVERVKKAQDQFQVLQQRARDLEEIQFVLHRAANLLPEWLMFASERWTENRRGRGELMNRYHEPILKDHQPRALILETVWTTTKDARPSSVLDAVEAEILYTCLQAIELREQLPERFGSVSPELLAKLKARATELRERMLSITQKLQTEAERLRNTSQTQWVDWRLKRDLLRCPNLTAATRRELLRKLIQESKDLAEDRAEAGAPSDAPNVDADVALWQMLCTIHALSLGPVPSGMANDALWDQWHKSRREDERGSRDALINSSLRIRKHWSGHLTEVTTDCGDWQPREATRACWERKDQSARILHPSDAIDLATKPQTPSHRFDQFLLAEMLLAVAERYTDDFWQGWYASASRLCLTKATELGRRALSEDCQKATKFLESREKNAQLALDCAPIEFGTRPTANASLQIKREKFLPRGLAALWLGTPENDPRAIKNLASLSSPSSVGFAVGDEIATSSRYLLSVKRPTLTGKCEKSEAIPKVFYRGHTFDSQQQSTLFNPCPPDGIVWHHRPAPSTGGIQVDGADRQSIVFVLDCSGSMLDRNQKVDNWTPATQALLKVLEDLLVVSKSQAKPIEFQLIVFGHQDPVNLKNMFRVEVMRPMGPLTRADDLVEVRDKLSRLTPWGYTPLLESIKRACETLASKKKPGAVVVITDGDANDGAKVDAEGKLELAPAVIARLSSDIDSSLKESRSQLRKIELHVIGLDFFGNVGADLKKFVQRNGAFYDHKQDGTPLQNLLGAITKPRPFLVRPVDGDGGERREAQLGNPIKGLPVGSYRVAFESSDRLKNAPVVELLGGELLKFQLNSDDVLEPISSKFTGSAPLYHNFKPSPYEFGWDSFRSFANAKEDVEIIVGVRHLQGAGSGELFTPRPRRIVVDLNPVGQELSKPLPMSWDIEPDRTRPTWSIKVTDWPSNSVSLRAYVSWELPKADTTLEVSALQAVPAKVELPIAKTERAGFDVSIVMPEVAPSKDSEDSGAGIVEVHLKPSGPAAVSLLEREWRHLAYLDVRLMQGTHPVEPITTSQEMLLKDHEVIWRFSQWPQNFRWDNASLAITSWYSFQREAFQIENQKEKPLEIHRRDEQ